MMFGLGEPFPYAECPQCGTVRLLTVPDDLSPYYPNAYYSLDLDPHVVLGRAPVRQFVTLIGRSAVGGRAVLARAARAALRKRQFQTLMSLLDSVALAGLPSGRSSAVLDVGCGSGVLVYALSLAGLSNVTGIDPFAPADRVLDTGARLLRRDLADMDGRFDLVMFHHSLEHVPDPGASLALARKLLSPVGRILVRMPTTSSQAFSRYREHWVQLDAPRHLGIFSRDGMARLCAEQGLDIVATKDDSTSFQFWGSEQVRRGIPLEDERSHMVNPGSSVFTTGQLRAWEREAARLNGIGDGDQSVWVLVPDMDDEARSS